MGDRVRVAVRVRPLNRRELDLESKVIVDIEEDQTILYHPKWASKLAKNSKESITKYQPKTFAFDYCFWSLDERNTDKFAGQQKVFECVGTSILAGAFEGYNACVLAYGQTGSGKSYTMMGNREQQGIIPRFCESLFDRIKWNAGSSISYKVQVSYMEIYNEKVRDLLEPGSKHNLTVREHAVLGPYVDGLLQLAVKSYEEVECLLVEGTKSRTVAATNMNSESSRSHAVFTLILVHTQADPGSGTVCERVSRVNLVDLAGSERASKTGSIGERLREGGNINRSLTTLGLVVKSLAEKSGKHHAKFVPYRDSVLTWLLKDSLGGNSKTLMLAMVSPAADNYEESLSTLRYADSAKHIMNHAVVNEDPNSRMIRELRKEIEDLRMRLSRAEGLKAPNLQERLHQSERLMTNMCKSWEEQLQEAELIHRERQGALEAMGIHVEFTGIKVDTDRCFLVNLNADPSLNELLVYYLKDHTTVGRAPGGSVGDGDSTDWPDIRLDGAGIMPNHCVLDVEKSKVYVTPRDGARTCINGVAILDRTRAKHGDRILWGNNHFFRLTCPKDTDDNTEVSTGTGPKQLADYAMAQEELMQQEMASDPIQGALEHMEKLLIGRTASSSTRVLRSSAADDSSSALWDSIDSGPCPADQTQSPPLLHGTAALSDPTSVGLVTQCVTKAYDVKNERLVSKNSRRKKKDDRQALDAQKLTQLRKDLYRAHCLVREANMLAKSVPSCDVVYEVSLQIPASELSPNLRQLRTGLACRPAIVARRRGQDDHKQLFTDEEFECRLVAMRDACLGSSNAMSPESVNAEGSPFGISNTWHDLIGVANIFLDALFHDVDLDHWAVIVSQYGEIAGRLHVTLSKKGDCLDPTSDEDTDGNNSDSDLSPSASVAASTKRITVRVAIEEAKDLPSELANFVFCQYKFWSNESPIMVPPAMTEPSDEDNGSRPSSNCSSVLFGHSKEFVISITEEFVDYISGGNALSIEVYGHRSSGAIAGAPTSGAALVQQQSRPGSMAALAARWAELTRRIWLHVQILELGDTGVYEPVELRQRPDVPCGGVFQLRQGYSRRLHIGSACLSDSDGIGQLPITSLVIESVCIGGICLRSQQQRGLDSYHEQGLELLRSRWHAALDRRRAYLNSKTARAETSLGMNDRESQQSLKFDWDELINEMDAMCSPAAGSGVPGAPVPMSRLTAASGCSSEQHVPVVFLDLKEDDSECDSSLELFDSVSDNSMEGGGGGTRPIGEDWLLDKEEGTTFIQLPLIQRTEKVHHACLVVASWDSTLHDSVHLNMTTHASERVYLTVKAYVRLGMHPEPCTVVLRKRICVSVYRKASLSDKLRRSVGTPRSSHIADNQGLLQYPKAYSDGSCSVAFDIITSVPKALHELERGEVLARLAATSDSCVQAQVPGDEVTLKGDVGGETYIEQYLRSIAAIESVILADKAGQEAAIKASLRTTGRPVRRFGSSPSVSAIDKSSRYLFSPRGEAVTPPLLQSRLAMSVKDLSSSRSPRGHSAMTSGGRFLRQTFALDSPTSPSLYTEANMIDRDGEQGMDTPKSTSVPRGGRSATAGVPWSRLSSPAIKSPTSVSPRRPTVTSSGHLSFLSCVGLTQRSGDDDDDDAYMPSPTAAVVMKGHDAPYDRLSLLQPLPEAGTSTSQEPATGYQLFEKQHSAIARTSATPDLTSVTLITEHHTTSAATGSLGQDSSTGAVVDAPCSIKESAAGVLQHGLQQLPSRGSCPLVAASHQEEGGAAEVASHSVLSDEAASSLASIAYQLAPDARARASVVAVDSNNASLSDQLCNDDLPAAAAGALPAGRATTGDVTALLTVVPTQPVASPCQESLAVPLLGQAAAAATTPARHDEVNADFATTAVTTSAAAAVAAATAAGTKSAATTGVPSRLELLSDPYSLSALDRLEAVESSDDDTSDSFGSDDDLPLASRGRALASQVVSGHGLNFAVIKSGRLLSPGGDNSDNSDDSSECSFGSTADLMTPGDDVLPPWLKRGTSVIVLSTRGKPPRTGIVKLIGETVIAPGTWVGVQFQEPVGKNDGSVRGVRYFRCPARHGVFVRPDRLLANRKDQPDEAGDSKTCVANVGMLANARVVPPGPRPDDRHELVDDVRAANLTVFAGKQGSADAAAATSSAINTGYKEPSHTEQPVATGSSEAAATVLWVSRVASCSTAEAVSSSQAQVAVTAAACTAPIAIKPSAQCDESAPRSTPKAKSVGGPVSAQDASGPVTAVPPPTAREHGAVAPLAVPTAVTAAAAPARATTSIAHSSPVTSVPAPGVATVLPLFPTTIAAVSPTSIIAAGTLSQPLATAAAARPPAITAATAAAPPPAVTGAAGRSPPPRIPGISASAVAAAPAPAPGVYQTAATSTSPSFTSATATTATAPPVTSAAIFAPPFLSVVTTSAPVQAAAVPSAVPAAVGSAATPTTTVSHKSAAAVTAVQTQTLHTGKSASSEVTTGASGTVVSASQQVSRPSGSGSVPSVSTLLLQPAGPALAPLPSTDETWAAATQVPLAAHSMLLPASGSRHIPERARSTTGAGIAPPKPSRSLRAASPPKALTNEPRALPALTSPGSSSQGHIQPALSGSGTKEERAYQKSSLKVKMPSFMKHTSSSSTKKK